MDNSIILDLKKLSHNFTLVISSSDKYFSLIEGFIYFLEKNFVHNPFVTLFVLEEEKLDSSKYISINNKKSKWSNNLCNALKNIDSKYIILMLDDYWIEDTVDYEALIEILRFALLNDVNHLTQIWQDPESSFHEISKIENASDSIDFFSVKNNDKYDYLLQASYIFNREFLIETLRKNETAWEFETNASYRFSEGKYEKNFRFYSHRGNPLRWRFSGVIEKGRLTPSIDALLIANDIILDWRNIKVDVSTLFTPIYLRAWRKLFRPIKRLLNQYYGKCN